MIPIQSQMMSAVVKKVLKRLHDPLGMIWRCARWVGAVHTAYPLSPRLLEEMMAERGVAVDHATVHRLALKLLPVLSKVFRARKRPVGTSWRMDETTIKVNGCWKYLYRAVDKLGQAVDSLLTAKRDLAAARRFFERAIDGNGVPEKITIDKSGADTASVQSLVEGSGLSLSAADQFYSLAF